ncbi:N-terminal domain of NEFA-interacting nuclear protein NIP30-domain-containing protein [Dissophora ornata]|nr:N-terminal domain of NEFA-interacting nuclear protein NIP30-domain-containing protein [Dissophora ornata]
MSSINFVSADAIEEARKARQKEWQKAYENTENPPPLKEEVPYDPRTLYERLQEQKQKKDDAFAEATKFGNLIHRIDNDEFDFLNTLENDEARKKRELAEQEEEELKKFRMNVQLKTAPPPSEPASLSSIIPKSDSLSSSSAATLAPKKKTSLFAGLVKRNNTSSSTTTSSPSASSSKSSPAKPTEGSTNAATSKRKAEKDDDSPDKKDADGKKPKVDAVVSPAAKPKPNALLSLVAYDSSSDDEDE